MEKTEHTKLFILKIYNPVIGAVKTYRNDKRTVKIGSGSGCDLQIMLPSLRQVHITADFEDRKITAVGNNVHCDNVPLAPGTSTTFSNNSIIRIHSIFMMFFVVDNLEELSPYDEGIVQEASRFKEYSPVLRIEHNVDTLGSSIGEDGLLKRDNGDMIDRLYERELGEMSKIQPIKRDSADGCPIPGTSMSTGEIHEPVVSGKTALDRAKIEFEEEYKVSPPPEVIEAVIHKKLDDIKEEVHEALVGDVNIAMAKKPQSDLGEIAIDNDLLVQAEREAQEEVLKADIDTLEQLKSSITDNIKEEIREEIAQIVKEEARSNVEREVEECLLNPKFVDVIVNTAVAAKRAVSTEAKGEGEDGQKVKRIKEDEGNMKVSSSQGSDVLKTDKKVEEDGVKRRKKATSESVGSEKKEMSSSYDDKTSTENTVSNKKPNKTKEDVIKKKPNDSKVDQKSIKKADDNKSTKKVGESKVPFDKQISSPRKPAVGKKNDDTKTDKVTEKKKKSEEKQAEETTSAKKMRIKSSTAQKKTSKDDSTTKKTGKGVSNKKVDKTPDTNTTKRKSAVKGTSKTRNTKKSSAATNKKSKTAAVKKK